MNAPLAIFRHQLEARLEYRGTLLFSLFLHPAVLLVTLALLQGIYAQQGHGTLLGYSLSQMVWYFGSTQFFYQLVWNTLEREVGERVLSGRIDRDLLRPGSLLSWELWQLCAQKVLCFAFEFVPVLLAYSALCPPDFLTLGGLARYLALTALAFLFFFLLSFLLSMLAVVWEDPSSLSAAKLGLVHFLSGAALPVAFYPEPLQRLLEHLPFRFLFHVPVAHLLGRADARWSSFAQQLGEELLWVLPLWALAGWSQRRLLGRLGAAGG